MSDDWATPQEFFDKLDGEFHFTVDVCADHHNKKVVPYFTKEMDGLQQPWTGRVWMNPPYGRDINKWMKKALESSKEGALVVALVPNRTNAPWWHDYVMKANEIRFVKKKLAFVSPDPNRSGVPFTGSVVVVFYPHIKDYAPVVSSYNQKEEAVRMWGVLTK